MYKQYIRLQEWLQSKYIYSKKNVATMLFMVSVAMLMISYVSEYFPRKSFGSFAGVSLILAFLQVFEFRISEKVRRHYGYFLLLVSPGIMFWGMEFISKNKITEMSFLNAVLNYILYLSLYVILYAVFNRISLAVILGNICFFLYIMCNVFVNEYRGTPIRAWDILAMRTALNVAGEYELKLTYKLAILLFWIILLGNLALKVRWREKRLKKRIVVSILLIIVTVGTDMTILSKEFIQETKLRPDWWQIEESAKQHGMFWDLMAGIPYLQVEKPEGYSAKRAKDIQNKFSSSSKENGVSEQEKPDIIAIMNESFSDLSVLGELQTTTEFLSNWNSISENTIKGNLYVPIRGGLTCNSEFEFITGFSCSFLPAGTIAYQTVIKEGTYNLAQVLNENGYHTTFMHPYFANGWNRNGVYRSFQFDESIFLEDMNLNEEDYVRAYVSDQANYRKIIEQYEEKKSKGQNMFLFDVTMQNHGGYGSGMHDVEVIGPINNDTESSEYLSLIKKSDEAFQELISYFSNIETPTVILMFGDHQPALSTLTNVLQEGTLSDDIGGKMEEYCVPFTIWANYEIEEKYYEGISVNYLQTILMETAGLPLDSYQMYLKNLMQEYPVITNMGVKDATGAWFRFGDVKDKQAMKEYSWIQYWKLIKNQR